MDLEGDPLLESIIPTYILKLNLIPTDKCNSVFNKEAAFGEWGDDFNHWLLFPQELSSTQHGASTVCNSNTLGCDILFWIYMEAKHTHIHVCYIKYIIYNKHWIYMIYTPIYYTYKAPLCSRWEIITENHNRSKCGDNLIVRCPDIYNPNALRA